MQAGEFVQHERRKMRVRAPAIATTTCRHRLESVPVKSRNVSPSSSSDWMRRSRLKASSRLPFSSSPSTSLASSPSSLSTMDSCRPDRSGSPAAFPAPAPRNRHTWREREASFAASSLVTSSASKAETGCPSAGSVSSTSLFSSSVIPFSRESYNHTKHEVHTKLRQEQDHAEGGLSKGNPRAILGDGSKGPQPLEAEGQDEPIRASGASIRLN